MKHRGNVRRALCLAAAILVFVLALLAARGYHFTWDGMQLDELTFRRMGPKTFSVENGDAYGVLNAGPNFALMEGTYNLVLNIDSDAENRVLITTSNGARVEPSEIVIPPHSWVMKPQFTLLDEAENLEILIDYQAGSYLAVHEVSMSMPCTDRVWMALLIALTLGILYVLQCRGYMSPERWRALLLVSAAVAFASVPALRETLHDGMDSVFHQMRIRNLVSALREGQFPVRVGGYMYNGYGSAAPVFYPDLILYIPALLMLTGTTIQFAVSVLIIAVNAMTAAFMYICAKRIFESRTAGVCAAIFYQLANYRLMDVYIRAAFGEMTAMAFLPLFVLGLWEVIWGDRKRWLLLTVSALLIFRTHMVSTVLCALLAVVICLLGARPLIMEKRWLVLVKAAGVTLLLGLYALVPVLTYMAQGVSTSDLLVSCAVQAMEPMYLFVTQNKYTRDIGAALIIGVAATAYALIGRQDRYKKVVCACIVLGAALAFMTTNLFPWAWAERVTRGATDYLQYPSRLLMFTDFLFALACGYGAVCLAGANKERIGVCVLALCIVCSAGQISFDALEDLNPVCYWKSNFEKALLYREYTIDGSDLIATASQTKPVVMGDAQVQDYEKKGTHITAQVSADGDAQVLLPVFGYDGYRAELDGEEIPWMLGDNNRLTVSLAAGDGGELRVWFAGKALWRAADLVSLAAALGLISLRIRRRRTGNMQ